MRILLIQPGKPILVKEDGSKEGRQAMFPLGLLYLASAAEAMGHEVQVLDVSTEGFATEEFLEKVSNGSLTRIGLPMEEVTERIKQARPDIVGVSCLLSTNVEEAIKCADAAKKIDQSIPVVMGGAHPSAVPQDILEQECVDYVIIGEGEESFCELLGCLDTPNAVDQSALEQIDGIAFKKSGEVVVRPKTKWIDDLDSILRPARHLVDLKRYVDNYYSFIADFEYGHTRSMEWGMYTSMLSSRGCPYNCYFCAKNVVWGRKYRARSVDSVVDEMEYLVSEYGIKEIHFEDENWGGNPKRAAQICREITKRNLKVAWAIPNGITLHTLSEELLKLMREAGAYSMTLSLESGCSRVCKEFIDKPLDPDKARRMVRIIQDLGFNLFVCFMIGFPGETIAEIHETIKYAESLDIDRFGFALATPLPGTKLLEICEEGGFLVDGFDTKTLRFSVGNIVTDEFNPAILERLRRKEYLRIHQSRERARDELVQLSAPQAAP